MTEREKIAQIIAEHLCPQGKAHKTLYGAERRCYSRDNFAECEKVSECVDALIAAGIGDVKEAEHRTELAEAFHNLKCKDYDLLNYQFEKMKHRAEAAEKALDKACENIGQLVDCLRWAANGGVITIEEYTPEKATPQAYIDRAEKELTEEKKDANQI